MYAEYYSFQLGWEYTQPGWYEYEFRLSESYDEFLEWLYTRIDNCERHARWKLTHDNTKVKRVHVKFRYERDLILFKLSW